MHLQAVLGLGRDGALHPGYGEVLAQVLQAGDAPGHGQGRDVARRTTLGSLLQRPRHFVSCKRF